MHDFSNFGDSGVVCMCVYLFVCVCARVCVCVRACPCVYLT